MQRIGIIDLSSNVTLINNLFPQNILILNAFKIFKILYTIRIKYFIAMIVD